MHGILRSPISFFFKNYPTVKEDYIDHDTIIVEEILNLARSTKLKNSQDPSETNFSIYPLDFVDIYRTFHMKLEIPSLLSNV